jgi:hypothetical protein
MRKSKPMRNMLKLYVFCSIFRSFPYDAGFAERGQGAS